MADLAPEGTIDTNLANGSKASYTFIVTLVLDGSGNATHFSGNANPQFEQASAEYYFVDDTAVIRHNAGAPADVNSDPIPR